ncbi:MAG TPA: DUF222 domain-containing protein [Polyangia bacterium]|jgi:hypothetical protein
MTNFADDDNTLGDEIARLAGRANLAAHRLLTCIRRFDVAEGWHRQGAQSCAHWLTWRIGLDPGAAREKVRVARALGVLPAIDRAFGEGRLSFAQVRAVTRIATPENEERVLEIALAATGAQLERICRGFRRATDGDVVQAADRRVRARVLGGGLVRLEVVLAADEAELVIEAIGEGRRSLSPEMAETKDVGADPRATAADGLVHLASAFLARAGDDGAAQPSDGPRSEVVIHVDHDVLADDHGLGATLEDGTRVSAETLRRVACDGGLVVVAGDARGQVLDVGRRTRTIPTALRRALLARERHCRFPGCANRAFLHGHHVHHWMHGGRTSLDNLLTLCTFHHRQVHEGGFEVRFTTEGALDAWTPCGQRLPAVPTVKPEPGVVEWVEGSWDVRDGERPDADGAFLPPLWDGEPVDYTACVDALIAA